MSLPELRDEAKHAQLCAQEDLLAAKKRRFAHFGLTNSASQRQDEAAVLRRLRYALIGDGAMTGGMAFVYDPNDSFVSRLNPASLQVVRIGTAHWEAELKALVEAHAAATDSALAARLLNEWDVEIGKFWQVVPTEIVARLEMPLDDAAVAAGGATPA